MTPGQALFEAMEQVSTEMEEEGIYDSFPSETDNTYDNLNTDDKAFFERVAAKYSDIGGEDGDT